MNRISKTETFLSASLKSLFGLATLVLTGASVNAAVICTSPDLPPGCGEYVTPQEVHTIYTNPGGGILETVLLDSSHHSFLNPVITPLAGGDELEEFDSTLSGTVRATLPFGGSTLTANFPYQLQGPVQVVTSGKTGNITGTFQTEMIAMDLIGNVQGFEIRIRESPTIASLGQVTITDIGGGEFQIESFFDVHTEVSVDGDPWVPAESSSIVNLVPEPSAVVLSLLGLLALFGRRRRA